MPIDLNAPFLWTKKREQACALLVEGRLQEFEICAKIGVSRQSLHAWKQHSEFKAKYDALFEESIEGIRKRYWAVKERRIESYFSDLDKLEQIEKERGEQVALLAAQEPIGDVEAEGGVNYAGGASTGFITRDYRGKDGQKVVYQFDAALFQAKLTARKQLSQELGQWVEKQAQTTPDGAEAATTNLALIPNDNLVKAIELLTPKTEQAAPPAQVEGEEKK